MEEKSGVLEKVKPVLSFVKKHPVLFTLLLVLFLQFIPNGAGSYPWGGIWMRMQSKELHFADSAAASSVENYVNQQASALAAQQYPNLPEANRQKVIEDLKKKVKEEAKDQLASEKNRLAQEIRNHYSYEVDGRTFNYMPDIDPYYYLRYARNIVEKGHSYDVLNDGVPWDNHMIAPIGTVSDPSWHPYVMVWLYRIGLIFEKQITLMQAANYFPVVFIFLSLIFAFLITQKLSNNIGGFFAVTVLALIPAVMSRTPWGHADTDAYNVFFPVLVVWLLFMALSASSLKKQSIFAGLAGLGLAVFSNVWTGWWYLFDFIIIALAVSAFFELITNFGRLKEGVSSLLHHSRIKKFVMIGVVFFVSSLVFTSITPTGFDKFVDGAFRGAFTFTVIKAAALPSLWPNVFTTVAELNPASMDAVVSSIGGRLMLFIALLGILLLLLKRDANGKLDLTFSALLAIWFIGTIYAALKGMRFTLLLGPAFAVAFGASVGLLCERLSAFGEKQLNIKRIITSVLVIFIVGLIIVNPTKAGEHIVRNAYATAVGDVPIVNDAWWNALTRIKDNSQPDAIINSWWDFGHHFKYIADRATTSDGAVQNSPQAHWVGRVLQTDDEKEAVAILRMLDCGANMAYDFALNATKDPLVSIKLVKNIIMQNKKDAAVIAEKAGVPDILKYTHCDPPEDFFIASGDMVGKSGVWAHFGLWSFERSEIWQKWRLLEEDEAVPQMMERFNFTKAEAEQLYRDANALTSEDAANQWISPWPGYISGDSSCGLKDNVLACGNIAVNLSNSRTEVRVNQGIAQAGKVVVYNTNGSKKVFNFSEGNQNLGVVVWPAGDHYKAIAAYSQVVDSMFTRLYYMNGLGLKHFKPFAQESQLVGGMIYVWKVDWEGREANIPAELKPKESVEPGARVKLNYIGWTDDGEVFDSSIAGWKEKNVSQNSGFEGFEAKPLAVVFGQGKLIPGFEKRIQGMKSGETRTITIPPEEAYGTDPEKHPLGNKTLHFKVRIEFLE